jgi:hypothetical protein
MLSINDVKTSFETCLLTTSICRTQVGSSYTVIATKRLLSLKCHIPCLVFVLVAPSIQAGISSPSPPVTPYENAMSFGGSYGVIHGRDADFSGWVLEYSRNLSGRWIASASLAWDEEIERFSDRPDAIIETYTLIGVVGYSISPIFVISAGFGKGILDNDNPDMQMEFVNGDSSVGISAGSVLPVFPKGSRFSLGVSLSYEYNLSKSETSTSVDLAISRSF